MKLIESMEDLAQARQEALKRQSVASQQQRYHIRISTGSCGIAVGAQNVYDSLERLFTQNNIPGVNSAEIRLSQIGCIGLCALEPIMQVQLPDQTQITYGKVTPAVARRIIEQHIGKGLIVQEHVVEYL